jgi:hypothetical protein
VLTAKTLHIFLQVFTDTLLIFFYFKKCYHYPLCQWLGSILVYVCTIIHWTNFLRLDFSDFQFSVPVMISTSNSTSGHPYLESSCGIDGSKSMSLTVFQKDCNHLYSKSFWNSALLPIHIQIHACYSWEYSSIRKKKKGWQFDTWNAISLLFYLTFLIINRGQQVFMCLSATFISPLGMAFMFSVYFSIEFFFFFYIAVLFRWVVFSPRLLESPGRLWKPWKDGRKEEGG